MALYAFNGTWNEDNPQQQGETGTDTNVVKFKEAYQGSVFYQDGVGTRFGFIGKLFGGIAGFGGRSRVSKAIDELKKNLAAGDTAVDVIGFSRGSALALHFANQVHKKVPGVSVRFLGLFDVVASFGIPGNDVNLGWELFLSPSVLRCAHAMALDERRPAFPVTRVLNHDGSAADPSRLTEMWFRGVHSDIGGGKNTGLTSISMTWMLQQALAAGAPVDPNEIPKYQQLWNPQAMVTNNLDFNLGPFRHVNPTDLVHPSVTFRPQITHHGLPFAFNNPPQISNQASGAVAG